MNKIQFLNGISSYRRLFIYGAGEYGKTLAAYLLEVGLLKNVVSFLVTKYDGANCVFGKSVKEFTEGLSEISENDLVVVAISESKQSIVIDNLNRAEVRNILLMSDDIYRKLKDKVEQNITFDNSEILEYTKDVLYGQNFDRVIKESQWLSAKDFASGGVAVSNQYMYMLYRILDSGKFHSFLDIGMGQTSKMMAQYATFHKEISHIIIEADSKWRDFFIDVNERINSKVELLEYEIRYWNGEKVRTFSGFKECLKNKKFDYISIDAPFGGDMKTYSRVDILDILPECLMNSWIIMMDDINRDGERNSINKIKEVLKRYGIQYAEFYYGGAEKKFAVLTSFDNRFFGTI